MDYYTSQPLRPMLAPIGNERRHSARKRLQRRVSIGLNRGVILQGHTIEISVGGVAVMLSQPLKIGEKCAVRFDLLADGVSTKVAGIGQVANCVCSGENFRVGLQLQVQDTDAVSVIAAYIEQI